MKTARFVLPLLVSMLVLAPQSRTTFAEGQRGTYSAKLLSPKAGDILIPGTTVKIEWTSTFPEVDLTMCETEVMLSVDGGKTFTFITSQRDPQIHYFNWIVPRSPTRAAILDIRFGCLGLYPETSSQQIESTFVISSMN